VGKIGEKQNPSEAKRRPAQPDRFTLAEAFEWTNEGDMPESKFDFRDRLQELNVERAIRSVAFLLDFCSARVSGCPGSDPVDGQPAAGLTAILVHVADASARIRAKFDYAEQLYTEETPMQKIRARLTHPAT